MVLLALAGCQNLRGPVWSPDGKRVAYTTYQKYSSSNQFATNLYLLESDDENPEPQLLGIGAACPCWTPDGLTLYFIGDRDAEGLYTKLMRFKMGSAAPELVFRDLKLSNFQMSVDGALALFSWAKDGKLGSPVTMELWQPATGLRTQLKDLNEVYSPALTPNGKTIAYAQKPAPNLPSLLLTCNLENGARIPKEEPLALFPTREQNELSSAPFVIDPFPDNERLLFYAPGSASIWSMKVDDHDGNTIVQYPLPQGALSPAMVAFSEDSSFATLSCMQSAPDKLLYQVYRLDFASKKFIKLDGNSEVLLGGHVLDPHAARRKGGTRYAWICGAGLALGEPGRARYFPANPDQCLAASAMQIRQGEPDKALAAAMKARELKPLPEDLGELDRAEARAYMAVKNYVRAGDAFERAFLLFPVGPEGIKYVFPPESGLPTRPQSELDNALREFDELIKTVPGNALLTLLKQGLVARSQGKHKEAIKIYEKAYPVCADEGRHGGIRFLQGMCAFESGDMLQAADKWEAVARNPDFPQADFAAGLSALAYALDGHPQSLQKAAAVLQAPAVKGSPLAKEYAQILNQVRGKIFREHIESKDAPSANKTVSARVETDRYFVPYASIKPIQLDPADKTAHHLGLRMIKTSTVSLGEGLPPLIRIPQEIGAPVFSPDDQLMAFSINGDVAPMQNKFCDLMVVNRTGKILFGSQNAATSGHVRSRFAISSLEWASADELKVSGSEVDVFGGETPFNRSIPLPHKP